MVFDRFHVVQLMNKRLDELRRELVREAEGPLKLAIKGTRYLLLTRAENCRRSNFRSWSGRSSSTSRSPRDGI